MLCFLPGGTLQSRHASHLAAVALFRCCPELIASLPPPRNETFWSNVPEDVWESAIGGYQILKKWLSYRERQVLGRNVTKDEAREFTHIVRRIAALLLLEPELDKNYAATKINSHPYKVASTTPEGTK